MLTKIGGTSFDFTVRRCRVKICRALAQYVGDYANECIGNSFKYQGGRLVIKNFVGGS
jgi:hypothetical protein